MLEHVSLRGLHAFQSGIVDAETNATGAILGPVLETVLGPVFEVAEGARLG